MKKNTMKSPSHATPAQTEGRLIRWAPFYNFATNVLTFGQATRLRTLTVDLAILKPSDSLLDVGCGTGGVTIPAKQRVGSTGKAAGIDPAPEMIAVATKNARRKGLEIDFRVGVIEDLPFPEASFDVVTASLMMHHLPKHLRVKGLAEIYRVLKPGGRILIIDMIHKERSTGIRSIPVMIMHHHSPIDGLELSGMLKEAGFREVTQLDQHYFVIGFLRACK